MAIGIAALIAAAEAALIVALEAALDYIACVLLTGVIAEIVYVSAEVISNIDVELPNLRGGFPDIDSEAILLSGGIVAVGAGAYAASEVTQENIDYAISIYGDLPPDLQCQVLEYYYSMYSNAGAVNELAQDMYEEDYWELSEDEMKNLMSIYAGQYDVSSGNSCTDLANQILNDIGISKIDSVDDEE